MWAEFLKNQMTAKKQKLMSERGYKLQSDYALVA